MNNFESYLHGKELYLIKKELINKINKAPLELLIKLGLGIDVGDKNVLIEINKELTNNDERELYFAALTLQNNLP